MTELRGLRVRVPESAADAAELRAEVRAADQVVGQLLRQIAAVDRPAQHRRQQGGGER